MDIVVLKYRFKESTKTCAWCDISNKNAKCQMPCTGARRTDGKNGIYKLIKE